MAYDLVIDRNMRDKAKVLRLIEREPGIKKGKLLSYSHLLARRLDEIVNTLQLEEKIEDKREGKGVYYYPLKQDKKKRIVDIVKGGL